MKNAILLVSLFLSLTLFAQNNGGPHPKLVVLIAIDGLRGDLLDRYKEAFHFGFKQLFDKGFEYKNACVDHAITVSHAGHVTLATGNFPSHHGIVDAAFYQQNGSSLVFTDAFADSGYTLTGSPDVTSISAKKVLTPGLSEWVRKADPSARSLCVGTGNISAALYCYHPSDNVFWYSSDKGGYVSSTYYVKKYPDWVTAFNDDSLPFYFKQSAVWDNVVPDGFLKLCNPDSAYFENYGAHHVFPYRAPDRVKNEDLWRQWVENTPFIDNATLALAKQGIRSLSLGQRNAVDFLSIVLSQVDNMSHSFGPSSLETFNVLMQIDIALGDFIAYLDTRIGRENYILALSADHGFAEIPEQTAQAGQWSKRITDTVIEKILSGLPNTTTTKIKDYLLQYDFIADVYTPEQLNSTLVSSDPFLELYKRSHRKDRVPRLPFFSLQSFRSPIAARGMMLRLKENAMIDLDCAIHGSPYAYDRSVPLFFLGAGIARGNSNERVRTVDVAPTLAGLAHLKVGYKVDGKILYPSAAPGPGVRNGHNV